MKAEPPFLPAIDISSLAFYYNLPNMWDKLDQGSLGTEITTGVPRNEEFAMRGFLLVSVVFATSGPVSLDALKEYVDSQMEK
jgi:hypothetical protein